MTNVARHAKATHAWVELMCDDSWAILQIQDDGLGFDPESMLEVGDEQLPGWGLIGVQERLSLIGGDVQIRSEPGKGTTLRVRVPVR